MSTRYWKVSVDCYQRVKPRSQRLTKTNRLFVVEAEDDETAFATARAHAMKTAPMGPKWVAFEVRSASTITLPHCIVTTTSRTC